MNKDKFHEYNDYVRSFLYSNRNYINLGLNFAKSITSFATNNNPLSFVEGGFSLLNYIVELGSTSSTEFFGKPRGWDILTPAYGSNKVIFDILSSCLESYPFTVVSYRSDSNSDRIYNTPIGKIGRSKNYIYYRTDKNKEHEIKKWELISFFFREKEKELKTNFYSLSMEQKIVSGEVQTSFELRSEDVYPIDSFHSDFYTKYFKKYLDAKINRSMIFLGQPGVGKTTLIQTIVKNLNLKAFKFKIETNMDLNAIKHLITEFKIDVLILDDFEQNKIQTNILLDFLEWSGKNIKLVLASSNSLREMHPAIIRPGRFSEIVRIEHVSENMLKNLLKDRYDDFKDQVNRWPIAYINEFLTRLTVHSDLDPSKLIEELNERVENAIELLK